MTRIRNYALSFMLIAILIDNSSSNLVGGPTPVSLDDPDVLRTKDFVVNQLASDLNTKNKTIDELVQVSRQIVAGTLLKLTFSIANSTDLCTVSVWEQKWLNKMEITGVTCGNDSDSNKIREKRQTFYEAFEDFKKTHKRVYKDKEENKKRYRIFRANLKKIEYLQQNEQGTAKYGVNEFADLSEKEFKQYLGLKRPKFVPKLPQAEIPHAGDLPEEFDWRHYNAVTAVKNQGSCGSCWAFSVTGNIEGQWAIRQGSLLSLSEQEIVDCDSTDDGCGGGYMTNAYDAIARLGGLETETDYPYEARNDQCKLDMSEIKVRIEGGVNITSNETEMAAWLVKNGPISVGLNANVMQFYLGGISHPFRFLCDPTELDHGVLIVGYGVHTSRVLKKNLPYWLIKNSWGKGWGELGYYRLYRGDGSCGINRMCSSAVIAE